MNSHLSRIYSEINNIKTRLSNVENRNDEKVDVESYITTNNIVFHSQIKELKAKIALLEDRIQQIEKKKE